MSSTFIAKTFYGLEQVLAAEILSLGGKNVEAINRAVSFEGDLEVLYRVNFMARTVLRVLKPILKFSAHNETVLYKRIRRFDWWTLFAVDETFVIDSTVNSDIFTHSKYVALKVKDAIVDQFRDKYNGRRPSVDLTDPTIRLNVHCRNNEFTISLDSSGDSLHKRGYRMSGSKAPLNEALAAGMILLSGWSPDQVLYDPMCGSGTILIEAAMIGRNIPPRMNWESFAFFKWKEFNASIWNSVRNEAILKQNKTDLSIFGSDSDGMQIKDTSQLIRQLGFGQAIHLNTTNFMTENPPSAEGMIIMNPPYGKRLEQPDINQFYKNIGDKFKQAYSGWTAWILSGNKEGIKRLGLRTSKKLTLYNGPIECKFHQYTLYAGSRNKD